MLLAAIDVTVQGVLTDTMALAAVALIGYLFGNRTRQNPPVLVDEKLDFEIARAALVAKELHQIADRIRQDVSLHQSQIAQFTARVSNLQGSELADGWKRLSEEAETLLSPTIKLTSNLSQAYDQLRKQSSQLMIFAETRTDPQTGACNRRAMEEQLKVLFSLRDQNGSRFSLTLFSMGAHNSDHSDAEQISNQLRQFAELLVTCSRDTDLVARSSSDEFVVLMPHTSLAGATVYSERLLERIDAEIGGVNCGGAVEVQDNDTPTKILARADSALYSARTNSCSSLYFHNGKTIKPYNGFQKTAEHHSQLLDTIETPAPYQADPALAGSQA
jgi:diguanylate cyclase